MKMNPRKKEIELKMGSSESSANYEGHIFKGKHNSYKLLGVVGSGGNGKVYDVELVGNPQNIPSARDGYVIKVLTHNNAPKRIDRFTREINTVIKNQNQVKGMLPIYDFSLGVENNLYWFLMPKARRYSYSKNNAYDKLKHMLDLGQIIVELHSRNFAHRDIKPDNILFYDRHIYLSDYGLMWEEDAPHIITSSGEPLGPYIIRPPEFERFADRVENIEMFCASDVYLFAKTLWMIVSKNSSGFFREYSRHDPYKCLYRDLLDLGITIEPLHLLMEGATKDNYTERISMGDCLRLIRMQLQIKDGTLPSNEIGQLAFSERITAATNTTLPNEWIYSETDTVLKVISDFTNVAEIVIDSAIRSVHLGKLTDIKLYNENVILLGVHDALKRRLLYVSIEYVKINRNGACTCKLKPTDGITDPSAQRITEINEFELISLKKAIMDVSITLSLKGTAT